MAGKQMSVMVEMIPTEGTASTKEVQIPKSATVEDALKAAGIDPKNKNVEVDGKVAKPGDKIADHRSKPRVTAREPARVSASERVAGS